jgi:hypothetical protein
MAMSECTVVNGFDLHAQQPAWTPDTCVPRSGHWREALVIHTTALHAAERLADPVLKAQSHHNVSGHAPCWADQGRHTPPSGGLPSIST